VRATACNRQCQMARGLPRRRRTNVVFGQAKSASVARGRPGCSPTRRRSRPGRSSWSARPGPSRGGSCWRSSAIHGSRHGWFLPGSQALMARCLLLAAAQTRRFPRPRAKKSQHRPPNTIPTSYCNDICSAVCSPRRFTFRLLIRAGAPLRLGEVRRNRVVLETAAVQVMAARALASRDFQRPRGVRWALRAGADHSTAQVHPGTRPSGPAVSVSLMFVLRKIFFYGFGGGGPAPSAQLARPVGCAPRGPQSSTTIVVIRGAGAALMADTHGDVSPRRTSSKTRRITSSACGVNRGSSPPQALAYPVDAAARLHIRPRLRFSGGSS